MTNTPTNPTPKKPGRRVPEKEIAALLAKHFGNISHVARVLGVDRSNLHLRINKSEKLKRVTTDARETMVDDGESALHASILKQEGWAVCFVLKTLGKSRGYVEKQEVEHSGKIENEVTLIPGKMALEEWNAQGWAQDKKDD